MVSLLEVLEVFDIPYIIMIDIALLASDDGVVERLGYLTSNLLALELHPAYIPVDRST